MRWGAGFGYLGHFLCQGGSRAVHWGCRLGWTLPCRSWREGDPAGRFRRTALVRWRTLLRRPSTLSSRELTQILCLLIIRSMSSLILRYFSSDSGLWPAESSASMSGLSQPFRPFLRSVWLEGGGEMCKHIWKTL